MADKKYNIDKARSEEDFDNSCLQPSDGAEYTFHNAIEVLQNGHGGVLREIGTGRQASISSDVSLNDWVYDAFKQKKK